MYVEIKTLAPALQSALQSVGYGSRDIEVVPAELANLSVAGGDGQRGFAILVNLDTGESKFFQGSWGGTNMFVKTAVDDSDGQGVLPPNGVVIKGTTGYPRTFARMTAHPEAFGRFLPPGGQEELSDEEQWAINVYCGIKGGARGEYLKRHKVTQATIDSLVERGYLKRNKAGSVSVSTKGKNARIRRNV